MPLFTNDRLRKRQHAVIENKCRICASEFLCVATAFSEYYRHAEMISTFEERGTKILIEKLSIYVNIRCLRSWR